MSLALEHSAPLMRKRILLTRPQTGIDAFLRQLQGWGAEVISIPLIQIEALPFKLPQRPQDFDLIFFTSQNAVQSFYKASLSHNLDWRNTPTAVVGPLTAASVQSFRGSPQYIAPEYNAQSAAQDFVRQFNCQDLCILWPCGNLAHPDLGNVLLESGAVVHPLVVYQTTACELTPEQQAMFNTPFDLVVFTSPSAVEAFQRHTHQNAHLYEQTQFASLGPKTTQAIQSRFGRCDIQAQPHTLKSLGYAIRNFYNAH